MSSEAGQINQQLKRFLGKGAMNQDLAENQGHAQALHSAQSGVNGLSGGIKANIDHLLGLGDLLDPEL